MTKHALLSASSSHRWLACPPSALLCAKVPDTDSPYAAQGTDAHTLCQYLLEEALGHKGVRDPTDTLSYYDQEMQRCAEGYRDFVMDQIAEIKKICPDPMVCVEQRLDYSHWVDGGFGTGDCVIVGDGILHVIDFKYGLGVPVYAAGEDGTGNPQLKCYALGALDTFGSLYDIHTIHLSIYQPRRDHEDTFTITREELLSWAKNVLAPKAKQAAQGEGEFAAGEHCQFCKVKATCRKRAEYNLELAKYDFQPPAELTEIEISGILEKADSLIAWANDVQEYALQQALSGTQYPGFKVVEGRSNRKYVNDAAVAEAVTKAGFDPYEKKLLGITAMTAALGKKRFNELLGDLIVKPQGKPVLVPASDTRPEWNTAANDFTE